MVVKGQLVRLPIVITTENQTIRVTPLTTSFHWHLTICILITSYICICHTLEPHSSLVRPSSSSLKVRIIPAHKGIYHQP